MDKYLDKYSNLNALLADYSAGNLKNPFVARIEDEDKMVYNTIDSLEDVPLAIEALEDGVISWQLGSNVVSYSKNSLDFTGDTIDSATTISVEAGDIVYFKGENGNYMDNLFSCTGKFNVFGNILSLVTPESASTVRFDFMFSGSSVISAENLLIPDQEYTAAVGTFAGLFQKSTLQIAPKYMPATHFSGVEKFYGAMFRECADLVKAPEILPAMTISTGGYWEMFYKCPNLTKAPKLPATNLSGHSYDYMFAQSGLLESPELPASAVPEYCYVDMFSGCTNLKTVKPIHAKVLYEGACNQMFLGCSALEEIEQDEFYFETTSGTNACFGMFQECTSLKAAPEMPFATDIDEGAFGQMYYKCSSLEKGPSILPATTLKTNAYRGMFRNCSSLKTAPEIAATIVGESSCNLMFQNCSALTTTPVLRAATLGKQSYYRMFRNCPKVNRVECYATDISASQALQEWLDGTSETGTFIKPSSVSYPSGGSGIPNGWIIEDAPVAK